MLKRINERFLGKVENILSLGRCIREITKQIRIELELEDAKWVEEFERLKIEWTNTSSSKVSQFISMSSNEPENNINLSTLKTLMEEWEMRKHLVNELYQKREKLSETVPSYQQFIINKENFILLIDDLKNDMNEYYLSIDPKDIPTSEIRTMPWQLKYASEIDPNADVQNQIVSFSSGKLVNENGIGIFEDKCDLCGISIQDGELYGRELARIHCLDCVDTTVCDDCWNNFLILQQHIKTLFHNQSSFELSKSGHHGNTYSKLFHIINQYNPHLMHRYVQEFNQSVLLRNEILTYDTTSIVIHNLFKSFENRPCIGAFNPTTNSVNYRTYGEVYQRILRISMSLQSLVNSNTYIAISMKASPLWYELEFAIILNQCTPCGIHESWSITDWVTIVERANIKIAFVDYQFAINLLKSNIKVPDCFETLAIIHDEEINDYSLEYLLSSYYNSRDIIQLYEKLELFWDSFRGTCSFKIILFFELFTKIANKIMTENGYTESTTSTNIKYSNKILTTLITEEELAHLEYQKLHFPDEFPILVIFSSGSTGTPKGVISRAKKWIEDIDRATFFRPLIEVSYLPPCWGGDKQTVWRTLLNGGCCGFISSKNSESSLSSISSPSSMSFPLSQSSLFDGFRAIAPCNIVLVPLVCLSLKNEYQFAIDKFTQEIIHLNRSNNKEKIISEKDLIIIKAKASSHLSGCLGKNIKRVAIGGAKVDLSIIQLFKDHFMCEIFESYGTSESGGITQQQSPLPGVKVKLIDRPDLGYISSDLPYPRGEICVKSDYQVSQDDWICSDNERENILERYLEDGYFRTGDIGMMVNEKVIIIDRAHSIIKLQNGQFLSPEKIEIIVNFCPSVNQSVVSSSSNQIFIFAIIIPTDSLITQYENGDTSLISIERQILSEIRKSAIENGLMSFEVPTYIILNFEKWTIENRLLTCNRKLNRKKIIERNSDAIEQLSIKNNNHENDSNEQNEFEIINHINDYDRVIELVKKKIGIILNIDEINIEIILSELGANSFQLIQISHQIRKLFLSIYLQTQISNEIPPLSIPYLSKSSIRSLVSDLFYKQTSQENNEINLYQKIKEDIQKCITENLILNQKNILEYNSKNGIFITGGTGYFGRYLVYYLLTSSPHLKLFCLVRSNDNNESKQRIINTIQNMNLILTDEMKDRIIGISGDIEYQKFNLNAENYNLIVKETSAIIHAACTIKFFNPINGYEILNKSNVLGTGEILKLSLSSSPPKYVHYISTMSVLNNPKVDFLNFQNVLENNPDKLLTFDAYSLTKLISEHLIHVVHSKLDNQSQEVNFNYSMTRLPLLTWDDRGNENNLDWINRFVESCIQLEICPEIQNSWKMKIPFLPVDICAKLITHFTQQITKSSLVSPSIITLTFPNFDIDLTDVLMLLNQKLPQIEEIPLKAWVYTVKENNVPFSALIDQISPEGELNILKSFDVKSQYSEQLNAIREYLLELIKSSDDETIQALWEYPFCNYLDRFIK